MNDFNADDVLNFPDKNQENSVSHLDRTQNDGNSVVDNSRASNESPHSIAPLNEPKSIFEIQKKHHEDISKDYKSFNETARETRYLWKKWTDQNPATVMFLIGLISIVMAFFVN